MAGFHIEHFGCRAARADGEAIGSRLLGAGHCIQQPPAADVVVVNTCSVTAEADRAARAFIRKAHRQNPAAKIVITGCYAQRAPQELAEIAGVTAVVGNSHKAFAPEIVLQMLQSAPAARSPEVVPVASLISGGTPIFADDQFAHSFLEEAQLAPGEQTRPNLKIQEGCNNRCTFCVIPWTRGSSKSLPRAVVRRQVDGFVAAGGNELVLSGINLGRWGRDLPERLSFAGLVREILENTALPRLRLSSIEPMDWDGELIGLMREFGGTRLARHAHLPLQSGSDAVLRRMHRRYRPWHYAKKIEELIKAAGPDLTVGADVMAGFPGETDTEFQETIALIRELPFGYLHLFPFSPRPGTRGWALALHAAGPSAATVEDRMAALRSLAAEKMHAHRRQFAGRELGTITLHTPEALANRGLTAALSENFIPVEIQGRFDANRLLHVGIKECSPDGTLKACEAA